MSKRIVASTIVFIAFIALQWGFAFVYVDYVMLYNQIVRPIVYGALVIFVFAVMGIDERPVLKAQESTLWALLFAMVYVSVLFVLGLFFGFGTNVMAPNAAVIVNNFWNIAPIFFMGNVIRCKLLKNVGKDDAVKAIVILTIAFTIVGLSEIRQIAQGANIDFGEFIFASVFFAIVLNLAVAYFAHNGSILSVFIISGVYSLPPSLSPVLPNIQSFPWALISTTVLGASLYVYVVLVADKAKGRKYQEEIEYHQHDSWIKQKLSAYNIIFAVAAIGLAAFFLGFFPRYPVAILTTSMTGTFDRGSLVLLHRVPDGQAYDMVDENTVVHFYIMGREYVHRVIEFDYNSTGDRVYITKGDANDFPDPWRVGQDDVIGVAWGFIPFVGYPRVALHLLGGGG